MAKKNPRPRMRVKERPPIEVKTKQKKNGLFSVVSTETNEILLSDLKTIRKFRSGLAAVEDFETLLWGFMNLKGELVIPFQYKEVGDFENDQCKVITNQKKEIRINKSGEVCIHKNDSEKVSIPQKKQKFINRQGRKF
ncbi:MAG TPA: WG repeat-containing protein [Candidatus Absconditabacterales bacterium]|nr:WG repeat-containing protein [Candidatus Absconditabacterales bacterium]